MGKRSGIETLILVFGSGAVVCVRAVRIRVSVIFVVGWVLGLKRFGFENRIYFLLLVLRFWES